MSITIEQLPNQPIVIVRSKGIVTPAMARDVQHELADIALATPGDLYCLADFREKRTSMRDSLRMAQEAARGAMIVDGKPLLTNIFVGHNMHTTIARSFIPQHLSLPVADDIEQALSFAHGYLPRKSYYLFGQKPHLAPHKWRLRCYTRAL